MKPDDAGDRFDYDFNDDEYCSIGGEMSSGFVWEGLDDLRPSGEFAKIPAGCTVLGELDPNQFHTAREGTREMGRGHDAGLDDRFGTAREGTGMMPHRSPSPDLDREIRGGVEMERKRNPQSGMVDPVRRGVREMERGHDSGLGQPLRTARNGTRERSRHGSSGLDGRFRTAREGSEDY